MNAFASECSSGCESGWTLYLEQSFVSPIVEKKIMSNSFCDEREKSLSEEQLEEEEEEEEDLSMVSDASSGPPHFNEEESYETTNLKLKKNNGGASTRRKDQHKSRRCEEQEAFLDDTASSQAFNFISKNNYDLTNHHASMESVLDYSQEFSTTHFRGRSGYQEHCGYVQPSLSGNQLQNNQWC